MNGVEMTKTKFKGDEVIQIKNKVATLMVTTEYGPRICFFGKNVGKNILYWDKDGISYKNWKLYGGHRVWLTRPLADETEDTYQEDNTPCDIEELPNGVIVKAKPTASNIVRGMEIRANEDYSFDVIGFIENKGPMLYSAGVWSPTCIEPEGKVMAVAIGDDESSWDAVKIVIPRRFAGNECKINDPQVSFTEKYMVVEPKGEVAKRCAYSAKGIVAMNWKDENLSFIKKVTSIRDGKYQMGGCNTALFVGKDNFMAEMETYGEEKVIYPGEKIVHKENWKLQDGIIDFQ